MANLEERIRAIVRDETGKGDQPGAELGTDVNARLEELQTQVDELKADFQALAGRGEG